eukprot:14826438-Alexandrium_andersonii.AAC.1
MSMWRTSILVQRVWQLWNTSGPDSTGAARSQLLCRPWACSGETGWYQTQSSTMCPSSNPLVSHSGPHSGEAISTGPGETWIL